jgi:hypothetical protein
VTPQYSKDIMKETITHFYIATPFDEYWSTGFPDYVIEAEPVDVNDSNLHEFQKKMNI